MNIDKAMVRALSSIKYDDNSNFMDDNMKTFEDFKDRLVQEIWDDREAYLLRIQKRASGSILLDWINVIVATEIIFVATITRARATARPSIFKFLFANARSNNFKNFFFENARSSNFYFF